MLCTAGLNCWGSTFAYFRPSDLSSTSTCNSFGDVIIWNVFCDVIVSPWQRGQMFEPITSCLRRMSDISGVITEISVKILIHIWLLWPSMTPVTLTPGQQILKASLLDWTGNFCPNYRLWHLWHTPPENECVCLVVVCVCECVCLWVWESNPEVWKVYREFFIYPK